MEQQNKHVKRRSEYNTERLFVGKEVYEPSQKYQNGADGKLTLSVSATASSSTSGNFCVSSIRFV